MNEWDDSLIASSGNFHELVQERIKKSNPLCILNSEEARRLAKLEAIVEKLKRGKNVKNC
jgi:hypothetical protein